MALAGRLYVALVLGFLYAPILVMAAMSFNASPFYMLPIDWTADWYVKLAGNAKLLDASLNSVLIALATSRSPPRSARRRRWPSSVTSFRASGSCACCCCRPSRSRG
jgi:hypothetical protein